MSTAEATFPSAEAQLRAAIEHLSESLRMALEGRFDFTVTPSVEDEAIQRLGELINFLLQSTSNALSDMEKCAWDLVAFDGVKSKFLTTVSHELRTPLTLILGSLEQLLSAGPDRDRLPGEVLESLERMRRNGARLLTLVNDLLDFTELEVGKVEVYRQPLDVADLVTQIVEESRPVAESRQLHLAYTVDEGLGHIILDPRLFEKIVLMLLGNALKFTPAGGRIDVGLRALGGELEFAVSDTGIGISEDELPLLFQAFQQVDASPTRRYEGLGLGLARVKEFTKLMGGDVQVTSAVDQGSRFSVRLPMAGHWAPEDRATDEQRGRVLARVMSRALYFAPLAQPSPAGAPFPPQVQGQRAQVLIAEENADMRAFLVSVLAPEYLVVTARSGKEALAAAQRCPPDVILSEVMLPEMSGSEFLEQIKKDLELRPIPFILLTARAGKAAAVDGLDHGADDYISKPFLPRELQARVRAAWRMRQLHKELAAHHRELAARQQALEEAIQRERETHRQLLEVSRQAGMAEVATSILHNIGNILNSLNVSAALVADLVRKSKIAGLRRATDLLTQHSADLAAYLTTDEKGRHLPAYLVKLAEHLCEERDALSREIDSMTQGIDHVKTVVAMQQSYARAAGIAEELSVAELLDDALALNRDAFVRAQIHVERRYAEIPRICVDRHKLLQILMNLLSNAGHALESSQAPERRLVASISDSEPAGVRIAISDNGIGIPADNLVRIFGFGFTTRTDGHGFGLHSSANAAKEIGGSLSCNSDGPGHGATFTLDLPASGGHDAEGRSPAVPRP